MRHVLLALLISPIAPAFAETRVETIPIKANAAGGMTRDAEGNIYLSDFGPALGRSVDNTKVYRFDPRSRKVTVFAEGFRGASGCCFDGKGNFYQSNPHGNQISRRTPDGKIQFDWVTEGLNTPIGIVANRAGDLFVCNCGSNSIRKITPDGKSLKFAESKLLNCPNGLTIDDEGVLYACNFPDSKVLKIDQQGQVSVLAQLPVLRGGPSPVGAGHLTFANGQLFVTAIGAGQVYRLTLKGELQLLAGKANGFSNQDGPAAEATFSKPNGIVADKDGRRLYVLCSVPTWPKNPQGLHPTRLRVITGIAPARPQR